MLGDFGRISVAEIIFYFPILIISFFVTLRYGFRRSEGWISLFVFSLVRMLAAVLSIVSRTQSNPSSGLVTAVSILQALGLSPLLHATLGFTSGIAEYGLPNFQRVLRIVRLVIVAGVIMAIIGGTKLSPDNSPSEQSSGHTLSKIGSMAFLAVFLALSGLNVLLWGVAEDIPPNLRKLLMSLSFSLPFLGVRILYSILNAFVQSPSQWSPITGNWRIFLVMGLMMEYIVVSAYVITGALVPLHKDDQERYIVGPATHSDLERIGMGNSGKNSPPY